MDNKNSNTVDENKVNLALSKKRNHYKRFREFPFLKREKETTTIIIGGLTERHNYFIRANMEGLGYKVFNLPTPTIEAFHIGREYGNNGQCNPAYFTIGNLISYLKNLEMRGMNKKEIINNHVCLTVGACGPCRFGMYESEFRLALRNSGFDGFRIFTFQQLDGLNQTKEESGLNFNEEFFIGLIFGIILGDILNDLAFKIRPYEVNPGNTDKVFNEITNDLFYLIKKRQTILKDSKIISFFQKINRTDTKSLFALVAEQLFSNIYTEFFKIVREKISHIQVDNLRLIPKVKITGEFWAQITEGDGNFKMFNYLEKEGSEIIIEPITNWLMYLLFDTNQHFSDRFGIIVERNILNYKDFYRKKILIRLSEILLKKEYNRLRKLLENIPQELSDQYKLANIAHKYYNNRARGGEGHLEVAKSIEYTKNRLSHMIISVKPFGCLPSTQSDGVHSVISSHYPELLFLPIETSGEGEINAYSRIQMALTEARGRCRQEFEKSLEETGLSVERIKSFVSKNPHYASAAHYVPKKDKIISRAANFVYHISKRIGVKQ